MLATCSCPAPGRPSILRSISGVRSLNAVRSRLLCRSAVVVYRFILPRFPSDDAEFSPWPPPLPNIFLPGRILCRFRGGIGAKPRVFHFLSGSRGALFCRRRPRCWRRHRNYSAWGFTGRRWMPKVGPWKFSENGSADARIASADGCPPPYRPPRADQEPPSPSVAAPSAPSLTPGPGASITRLHSPQKEENNG